MILRFPSCSLILQRRLGDFYFGTSSAALDAVYRYDPDTGTSMEAFSRTSASGDISNLFDLSEED